MRGRRGRPQAGQALLEMAVVAPILLLITLGATDFARAFAYADEMSGAARAGAREAITSDSSDIGDAVRSEPNSAIPDTATAWGPMAPGGTEGACTAAPVGSGGSGPFQDCGDPSGCPAASFTGSMVACFAMRTCTLSGGDDGTCTAYGNWGTRPLASVAAVRGIEVVVAYKYLPLNSLAPSLPPIWHDTFILSQELIADELYF